jgi:hypothetical protein
VRDEEDFLNEIIDFVMASPQPPNETRHIGRVSAEEVFRANAVS